MYTTSNTIYLVFYVINSSLLLKTSWLIEVLRSGVTKVLNLAVISLVSVFSAN